MISNVLMHLCSYENEKWLKMDHVSVQKKLNSLED